MEVKERIAYVRGLLEGSESLERDAATKSAWENLLLVCDELADSVSELHTLHHEIEEYVEGVDSDLADLEEEVYGEEAEDEYIRTECPTCGEEVWFEQEYLYDDDVEITCPDCGRVLYRSLPSDDESGDGLYPNTDLQEEYEESEPQTPS